MLLGLKLNFNLLKLDIYEKKYNYNRACLFVNHLLWG